MLRLKRRSNYVDSSVQGALMRRIFLHWIVFFFVTTLSVVLLQTLLGDPSKPLVERLRLELGEFVFIGLILLALLPAFMLDTVRFSNRFVGPIVRLRRHLHDLGENGQSEPCSFRENDFWEGMATEFNKVVKRVESQQAEIAALEKQLAGAKQEA